MGCSSGPPGDRIPEALECGGLRARPTADYMAAVLAQASGRLSYFREGCGALQTFCSCSRRRAEFPDARRAGLADRVRLAFSARAMMRRCARWSRRSWSRRRQHPCRGVDERAREVRVKRLDRFLRRARARVGEMRSDCSRDAISCDLRTCFKRDRFSTRNGGFRCAERTRSNRKTAW
jgi:hypothetical protein